MTYDETIVIMGILKTAYPSYYRDLKKADAERTISLWREMFADEHVATVAAAVKALIATDTKGYPPHIGAVKEQIARLSELGTGGAMTEQEAWQLVYDACSKGYDGTWQSYFDALPGVVRRIVGTPTQLKIWAYMDESDVQTVVASNFMRSYRMRAQSEREFAKLPESVSGFYLSLSEKMALPELPEEERTALQSDG